MHSWFSVEQEFKGQCGAHTAPGSGQYKPISIPMRANPGRPRLERTSMRFRRRSFPRRKRRANRWQALPGAVAPIGKDRYEKGSYGRCRNAEKMRACEGLESGCLNRAQPAPRTWATAKTL